MSLDFNYTINKDAGTLILEIKDNKAFITLRGGDDNRSITLPLNLMDANRFSEVLKNILDLL